MTSHSEEKTSKFKKFLQWFGVLLRNSWIRTIFLILALSSAIYYISGQYKGLVSLIKIQAIQVDTLVFSCIIIFAAVILGVFIWWLILAGFGYSLHGLDAARIHIVSTLAKYIPGVIWQFSGKAYLTREMGVPIKIAGFGMAMEVGLSLISGIGITCVLSPLFQMNEVSVASWIIRCIQVLGTLLLLSVILSPLICQRLFRKLISENLGHFNLLAWFGAVGIILGGWIFLSFAFFLSGRAFGLTGLGFWDSLFAVCGSFVSGIMVIMVPNGLVIREAVMLALLPPGFENGAGLLLSLVSRFQVVISELLVGVLVGIAWFINKQKSNRTRLSSKYS